jgi:hypothetical protein
MHFMQSFTGISFPVSEEPSMRSFLSQGRSGDVVFDNNGVSLYYFNKEFTLMILETIMGLVLKAFQDEKCFSTQ